MRSITVASRPVAYGMEQSFFLRFAVAISVTTVLAFVLIAARGLTDPLTAPVWVHVHALLMVGWLALFVTQNQLAASNLRLHRKLGVAGAVLAAAMMGMGIFVAIKSTAMHRMGSAGGASYVLAETLVHITVFAGMVAAAIGLRRQPAAHKRLMFGATIMICGGPALARLVPSLTFDPRSAWLYLALDLALLLVIARHDQKTRGSVHPATMWAGAAISLAYVAISVATYNSSFIALANHLGS